ncbi:hypothetical protein [Aeromicrobium sp.]|uniref:hypothetical protein n=1 Tax=Aeromicrobium sp. TaxID=1871063 RepID=UPI002FCAB245
MPAWLSRLLDSPRALAITGAGLAAAAAVVTALLVLPGDAKTDDAKPGAASPSASAPSAAPTADEPPPTNLPPDKDVYCPAFRQIKKGGLASSTNDEDADGVDLAELSRVFETLIARYGKAGSVSPKSLRDDYARTVGFLREGKKAVDSKDVDLLKALALNLETLNDSMEAIESKSAKFCR